MTRLLEFAVATVLIMAATGIAVLFVVAAGNLPIQ